MCYPKQPPIPPSPHPGVRPLPPVLTCTSYDAAKAGDAAKVTELLAAGANPNAPVGKKGMTAMHRV